MSWTRKLRNTLGGNTLLTLLMWRVIPVLVVFMLFVTGVAVMASRRYLIGEAADAGIWTFWRVVILTGFAEVVCLMAAIYLLLRLYRTITRPLSDMAREIGSLVSSSETKGYGTIRDFDELVALSKAFDHLFRLQQRRIQETEDLASAVLHDLRTPLTHVRNETELAYRRVKPPMDAIGEIAEVCDSMLEVVEMDAEISRTSLGLEGSHFEVIDVVPTIDRCVDLYAPVAEAKSISLDYKASSASILIRGQAGPFQRMISNLLDNAIKYTPEKGRIAIEISDQDSLCRVSVSDTGIGISAEDLPKIFKRFYRTDASRTEPGHGLGLSLVSAIAEAHGGKVFCTSTQGKGSTFTVELPRSP